MLWSSSGSAPSWGPRMGGCSMRVKWREIHGFAMRGRPAGSHRGLAPWFHVCNYSLVTYQQQCLSLGGGRHEENEVGELSHCPDMIYPRGWQTSPAKGQTVNILCVWGRLGSVTTTQLHHCIVQATWTAQKQVGVAVRQGHFTHGHWNGNFIDILCATKHCLSFDYF